MVGSDEGANAVHSSEVRVEPKGEALNLPLIPTLTYAHELWVVIERMKWKIQEAEISLICLGAWLSLRDRVRS